MAPAASTSASPLSRLLLSLPRPGAARQPSPSAPRFPPPDGARSRGAGLALRRREAAAAVLSAAFLSRLALPAAAGAEECPLEVAPSGLAFCDRVVGTGAAAQQGQLIRAHYTGRLEDGTVFDSSYKRGKPLTFRVGVGEVIKGWDQGIVGGEGIPPMLAGGKRTLKLPPALAYGEKGAGCRGWEPTSCVIPPNSTLLFDVEPCCPAGWVKKKKSHGPVANRPRVRGGDLDKRGSGDQCGAGEAKVASAGAAPDTDSPAAFPCVANGALAVGACDRAEKARFVWVCHVPWRVQNHRARICSLVWSTIGMDDGHGHQGGGGGDGYDLVLQKQEWIKTQDTLKSSLILEDDFLSSVPSVGSGSDDCARGKLKYIGGTDISFLKENPSMACAAVVVLDADTLEVVHEEFDVVHLQVPYIPGFLAFREAPILLGLLEKVKANAHHFYPQLLMVDGNGLLHPRGFGLACHLGVLANIPTIGVGKNLHHVDGLNQSEVRRLLESQENCNKELISLTGQSGTTWGVAMRSCPGSSKAIYISVGHRISLDSAAVIVRSCCKYRVPEPTRQADIRSKVFLQKLQRTKQ
ncbi:hypothetical protein BS78_10G218300 [Paspalum vaginatum]|nr:hypothetical protein BS78_10G218300 [Paspalum vaginatum]